MAEKFDDGEWMTRDCPRCRAPRGSRCRNYKGQAKFACPARKRPPRPIRQEEPARQLTLF